MRCSILNISKLGLSLLTFFLCSIAFGQSEYKKIKVTKDIELYKLSNNVYLHTTYAETPEDGRFASNGILVVEGKEALLFDTPLTEDLTKDLVSWIHYSMKLRVTSFVPNHWHRDCMGGMGYLHQIGVVSYANKLTSEIARLKQLPVPKHEFTDSLVLFPNLHPAVCYFLGAAHSLDNIVVWLPEEQILFAGCMVKALDAKTLGNTTDSDLSQWPATIDRLIARFPTAQLVIPGHGLLGSTELLRHTKDLLKK